MIHFLGIGAQKAGTTWLYEQLRAHPDIRFPAGKEVHFWDQKAKLDEASWLASFPDAPPHVRQGEITPAYAMLDRERILRIQALVPRVRIFYSLRNPIARAWSGALMALARAEMTLSEASDQWFVDHFRSAGSMGRGAYTACLKTWRSVFPAEQLAIVLFDEIVSDPQNALRKVCVHIGVDERSIAERDEAQLKIPAFKGTFAAIRPNLLVVLRNLYEPEISALSKVLDRDLSHWLSWDNSGG